MRIAARARATRERSRAALRMGNLALALQFEAQARRLQRT
jgi:hypothetical protein